VTPSNTIATASPQGAADKEKTAEMENKKEKTGEEEEVTQTTFITVVTRATSPTPPATMSYVRTRRADLARVIEKTIEKPKTRPQMVEKEVQSDLGDSTRLSRYGVSSRWSMYLDRYPSAAGSYSPVSRYTSRYGYSSKCDDKETAVKSSAESTSTNEAPNSSSSTAGINKGIAKDTALTSQKFQTSVADSSERRVDDNIKSVNRSDSLKCDDKPMAKELNTAGVAESRETPRDVSIVGSSKGKDTVCLKSKTLGADNKEKPADCFAKNYRTVNEPEVDRPPEVKSVNNTAIKQSTQNTEAVSTSSAPMSTAGSSDINASEGVASKLPVDVRTEGAGVAQVKPLNSSSVKYPTPTCTPHEGEVASNIKSKNSSSTSVSSEDISDRTSSMEGNKTSEAVTASAHSTKAKSRKNISVKSSAQTGTETPVGMKSRSSSLPSNSSDESSVKTSSTKGSISKTASDKKSGGLGLIRTKSLKNVNAKHPVAAGVETAARMNCKSVSSASLSSEGATDEASFNEANLSRTLSEEGSLATTTSNNEVSLSKSSSNDGPLRKTTSLSTSSAKPQPNTPSCKLPPPVPKTDCNTQTLKTCSSLHSLNKFGVANKDFRKSALNVELSSALQAEQFKKQQEQQRHASTSERKFHRSNSMSSGDSDPSCGEAGSTHSLPVEVDNTVNSVRTSKSLSKLYSSSSTSKVPSRTSHKDVSFPNKKSQDTNKSTSHAAKACSETPRSHAAVQRHELSASDTDVSSNESSSSSESSSSDEENDGQAMKYLNSANLQHRTSRSPPVTDSQHVSVIPVASSEEMCTSADKPPRPPVSPKPHKTDASKSFLMRALAPVTNLFRGKQDHNNLEGLKRASSTKSLNREHVDNCQDGISDGSQNTETGSKKNCEDEGIKITHKYKIRKQESGERAWWMASNPNIPEGIKRLESNTSLNKLMDVERECNKTEDIQKFSSNDSLDKVQERRETNGDNEVKTKRKSYKISHQKSGESPWWYNSGDVQEGVKRQGSNSSLNKLQGDRKLDVNKHRSEVDQKTSSATSLHQNNISQADASVIPLGVENAKEQLYRLRHQESGELPWWLDSSAPVPEGVKRIQSNTSVNKLNDLDANVKKCNSHNGESDGVQRTSSNISINKSTHSDYDSCKTGTDDDNVKATFQRLQHQQSGELPWWLDSSAPVPEGIQRFHSNSSINKLQDSDEEKTAGMVRRKKSNVSINRVQDCVGDKTTQGVQRVRSNCSVNKLQGSESDSKKSTEEEKAERQVYKIRHQESGELPWWVSDDTSHSEVKQGNVSRSGNAVDKPEQKDETSNCRNVPYKLTHQESGERAWWLSSRGDIPEGVQRFDSSHSLSECLNSREENRHKAESSSSENSEEELNEEGIKEKEEKPGNGVPKFPLVLPSTGSGGKTSQFKEETGRRSPYDNIREPQLKATKNQVTKSRPKHLPLFIGNHTNIDDILGTAAALVNPVMGLSKLRKKPHNQDDGSSNEEGNVILTVLNTILQA
jgi:hypothetical protein